MYAFRLGPPRIGRGRTERSLVTAQCRADTFRQVDGDKGTHSSKEIQNSNGKGQMEKTFETCYLPFAI
jgi:hypothetical protein